MSLATDLEAPPVEPRRVAWSSRSLTRFPELGPVLFVVAIVILGNVLYLLHVFDPNPINTLSSLGTHVQKGPSPGLYYIDPNMGFTAQALGHRAALNALHLHTLWWNPYEGIGTPLAGEMNSAAFFPPNLLLALSTGQLYFHMLLEATAGISTVFLLRRLGLSRWVSAVGGAAFALNGTYSWLFHSAGNPVAFLPMAILGIEIALGEARGRSGSKGWVLLAIALALSLYSGFPETAFLDGLLIAVWTVVRAVQMRRDNWKGLVARIAAGAGVGLLLAAPILVAFVDYLQQADIGGHSQAFATYSEPGTSLPPFLLPYVYGPIFAWYSRAPGGPLTVFWDSAGGYFGAVLCVLAVVGLVARKERALKIALAAWVLLGLARTFGFGPAITLLNLIPGVKTTAFFRYAPASWELCVVVLAAFGLESLIRERQMVVLAGTAAVVLVGVALAYHKAQFALRSVAGAPHNHAWALASAGWAAITVVALLAAVVVLREGVRAIFIGALVLLDATLMFAVPQFSAPRSAVVDTKPVAFLQAHLGINRFFTLGPLSPDYGSYYGLASVAVNDLPTPKKYGRYIKTRLNDNADPITFTGVDELDWSRPGYAAELLSHLDGYRNVGVKYVLAPAGTELPPAPDGTLLRPVFSDGQVEILYLPGAKPFFEGSGCSVLTASWNFADLDCAEKATVVRRELSMPGWQASVNGRPTRVGEAQRLFQTVSVPAGRSIVRFAFTPPHEDLGYLAFVGGTAAVCAPGFVMLIRRRRRPGVATDPGPTTR